jgi:hypothetical protein
MGLGKANLVATIFIVIVAIILTFLVLFNIGRCNSNSNSDPPAGDPWNQLDTNLVYGSSTPALDGIASYLSPDGSAAYFLYVNNADATPWTNTQPVAQILKRGHNNQLTVSATLPYDSFYPTQFPYVAIGSASKDFTRFSILGGGGPIVDEDEIEQMRIQVLDINLNVRGSRIITDINFQDLVGGTFSEDNRYLVFGYSVPAPAPSLSYNTYMYILDANDPNLGTVCGPMTIEAGPPISGTDFLFPGVQIFTLLDNHNNKHYYFTFANSQFNSDTGYLQPPYYSQVYSFNPQNHTISFVTQQKLAKYAEGTIQVRPDQQNVVICHGGQCTIDPSQPNIYTVVDADMTGDNPPDYNAITVFNFNVNRQQLEVIFKQQINCCSFVVMWPPSAAANSNPAFFAGQSETIFAVPGDPSVTGPAPVETWSLNRLRNGPNGPILKPTNGPNVDLKRAWTAFSQDGNWMLRTGQFGYLNDDPTMPNTDSIGIKNILLFKVSNNQYSPFTF